ncbi:sodium channel protein Nach [Drosophila sulfurigaster albostrigata]|uniref:sodium channel protein Nach n=1 Tax=Drosophila sulfurigaster albostrigata TaxID=89887 RepID=UPI002D21C81B|nr:sodium channel protein Nach [Drosophila sulfurigaster albostrigata]
MALNVKWTPKRSASSSRRQKLLQLWRSHPLRLAIANTFWEYTERTKVSGMWLLRRNRTHGLSRYIWATVLIGLLQLSIYLTLLLWLKFYSYPILNTISNDLSITDVAFPGVTICSPKAVNMERVERYVKTLHIPPEYDVAEVAAGFDFLNAFTDQSFAPPSHDSYKITDAVLRLNNVSIWEAAMAVSPGCADFVKRCFWGYEEFPCNQTHEYLSFIPTTAFLGPCCSFNYNPRNISYVPFSANIFGMDGGLTFIGAEGSERNLSTGLIVLVHHPMDYVTETAASVTITARSESFVEVSPTVQSSSTEVLELSESKRDCLISDDLQLRNYRQAACMLSCQTEAIGKRCGCHPYLLPVVSQKFKECNLNDTFCYSDNYDNFKSVRCDQCLPNCYDVTYSTLSYKTDLNLHQFSVSNFYTPELLNNDSFVLRVYLAKQVVPVIRKVTVMSWIGLLSDLGGIFNLCLGLSMISVVEFFYYCTFRLYKNYVQQKTLEEKRAWK